MQPPDSAELTSIVARSLICLLVAAALGASVGATRAAAAPGTSLLAPAGVCGPAADRVDLGVLEAVRAMTCLTNYARTHSGLEPLAPSRLLNRAGQAKLGADISCAEFSHSPCGKPFQAVFGPYLLGASSYTIGENIAWSSGNYGTPRETMNGWLNSPEHRQNILATSFRDLGIGYLAGQAFQGTTRATLWSQELGARSPVARRR